MRGMIILLAIAGLGGVAEGASLPARAAGMWQSTTTVTGADGKPMANATDVVTVDCVDPATDLKFFTSGGRDCSSLVISGGGETYHINGTCAQGGKPVIVNETLVYSSAKAVTLTAKLNGPMGPVTVTSQLVWKGVCLPGMAPGDEGNVDVNGAFSKADNINDPDNQ